eukprot:m.143028 g.143028  ORF g.143028 m.143028 type:complete len:513 (+) comp20422_c0_seq5:152-1690(+)
MSAASSLEVESADVVRLVLQYLREANLPRAMQALQDETGVMLNTVDSLDSFVKDCKSGHWDTVLRAVSGLKVPTSLLQDLYEQIVLELIETGESGAARTLLRQTQPMTQLKHDQPDRYMHMEDMLAKGYRDHTELFPDGVGKEQRRTKIAEALAGHVNIVPPSRLLSLIQQALKWQQHIGQLPPGAAVDVFRGKSVSEGHDEDHYPTREVRTIKFGKSTHCQCAVFSPDGQHLVTGSSDGLIEVWNYMTGKLAKDLKYQFEDAGMLMESAVMCLGFSRDSEMLASADKDGRVVVWKLATGRCLRKISAAHSKCITSIQFSKENSQLLTSSYDLTAKIHGLKSAKMLKEFKGHTSFVNSALWLYESHQIVTGSSDCTVKVWNVKTAECVRSFKPTVGAELSVLALVMLPRVPDHFIVLSQSSTLCVMNVQGQVTKAYSHKQKDMDFTACCLSPKGEFVYATALDKSLHCFQAESAELEHSLEAHNTEITGCVQHPHQNMVATFAGSELKLWRP